MEQGLGSEAAVSVEFSGFQGSSPSPPPMSATRSHVMTLPRECPTMLKSPLKDGFMEL